MAKLESSPSTHALSPHYLPWHAHITALTVAPSARRLGLARILSASLESAGDAYDAYFIDLFVRRSNDVAIALYRGLGYSVWRTVENYYCDTVGKPRDGLAGEDAGEDAWDMRKALARDRDRKHVREHGEDFVVMPEDVW